MTTRIAVDRLEMRYDDRPVLDGVTFSVDAGEVFALLGPNGAGKTTTVEILEGYRERTGGDVLVVGVDPANSGRRFRDRIGIVLQSTAVESQLTVIEATRQQASYHSRPIAPGDALDLVGLSDRRLTRVGVLSGGQRRRLDLALAIVGRPDVLFLDEPTTGFDPEARLAAWRLIDRVSAEGVTVLLTTHDLDEAERLAHRIGILHEGRLQAVGTIDDLTGTTTQIRFRTARPEAVVAAVGARREGDDVVIDCVDTRSDLHRFTERALDEGWSLESLRVGPPRLEDVYLRIVRSDG